MLQTWGRLCIGGPTWTPDTLFLTGEWDNWNAKVGSGALLSRRKQPIFRREEAEPPGRQWQLNPTVPRSAVLALCFPRHQMILRHVAIQKVKPDYLWQIYIALLFLLLLGDAYQNFTLSHKFIFKICKIARIVSKFMDNNDEIFFNVIYPQKDTFTISRN